MSAFLAISFVALAGCGGGGSSEESTGPGDDGGGGTDVAAEFSIEDNRFIDPQGRENENASVTISVGETVRWSYVSYGESEHTVTSGEGQGGDSGDGVPSGASDTLRSGTLGPGDTYTFTFETAGTWTFYCRIHPGTMFESTVVVQSS